MAIFNITRKTDVVVVGSSNITLTEPSALERMAFGEIISSAYKEGAPAAETLKIEVKARINLIADCMMYTLDGSKDEVIAELSALPPEYINDLSVAALKLSGQWFDTEEEDQEKKSQTPAQ